jgi:hypothetical protein
VRDLALIILIGSMTGCVGDLVELTPQKPGDMAGMQPATDGPTGNPSPDGGTPQSVKFDPDIQADITTLGCANQGCHGGTTNVPVLGPANNAQAIMANYTAFVAQANNGANSPVLTNNLNNDGVTHTGGKPFMDTTNAVYQRWLGWINAGNPP